MIKKIFIAGAITTLYSVATVGMGNQHDSPTFWTQFKKVPQDIQKVIFGFTVIEYKDLIAESSKIISGHEDWIVAVAISTDNSLVATGSHDNTAKLWNALTGKLIRTLSGHTNWVCSVAISPHKKLIATGGTDHQVLLWDIDQEDTLHTLSGHVGSIRSITFSPDNNMVITGSDDTTARLWNTQTGLLQHILFSHTGAICSVAINTNNRLAATGSVDKHAKVWDINTGGLLHVLSGHAGPIRSLIFNTDNTLLATGSEDGTAKIWKPLSGELLTSFSVDNNEKQLDELISPQNILISNSLKSSLDKTTAYRKTWDIQTGKPLNTLLTDIGCIIQSATFSTDGTIIVATCHNKKAGIFNLSLPAFILRILQLQPLSIDKKDTYPLLRARFILALIDAQEKFENLSLDSHGPDGKGGLRYRIYTECFDQTYKNLLSSLIQIKHQPTSSVSSKKS